MKLLCQGIEHARVFVDYGIDNAFRVENVRDMDETVLFKVLILFGGKCRQSGRPLVVLEWS